MSTNNEEVLADITRRTLSTPFNGPPRGMAGPVFPMQRREVQGQRPGPLSAVSKAITALTFHDCMRLAGELVGQDGYQPPKTAHDMADLLSAWAIAERDRSPG